MIAGARGWKNKFYLDLRRVDKLGHREGLAVSLPRHKGESLLGRQIEEPSMSAMWMRGDPRHEGEPLLQRQTGEPSVSARLRRVNQPLPFREVQESGGRKHRRPAIKETEKHYCSNSCCGVIILRRGMSQGRPPDERNELTSRRMD